MHALPESMNAGEMRGKNAMWRKCYADTQYYDHSILTGEMGNMAALWHKEIAEKHLCPIGDKALGKNGLVRSGIMQNSGVHMMNRPSVWWRRK